jgi:hypothetical protein
MKHRLRFVRNLLASICISAIAIGPTVLASSIESSQHQALAALRFGNAVQTINWGKTSEEAARVVIENAMRPTNWQFERFEMRQPTADNPRLLSADLKEPCLDAVAWATALGQPYKLTLTGTDNLLKVDDPRLIERHIQKLEKNAFPISGMHYLLQGQPKYELMLFGKYHCLKTVIVQFK